MVVEEKVQVFRGVTGTRSGLNTACGNSCVSTMRAALQQLFDVLPTGTQLVLNTCKPLQTSTFSMKSPRSQKFVYQREWPPKKPVTNEKSAIQHSVKSYYTKPSIPMPHLTPACYSCGARKATRYGRRCTSTPRRISTSLHEDLGVIKSGERLSACQSVTACQPISPLAPASPTLVNAADTNSYMVLCA